MHVKASTVRTRAERAQSQLSQAEKPRLHPKPKLQLRRNDQVFHAPVSRTPYSSALHRVRHRVQENNEDLKGHFLPCLSQRVNQSLRLLSTSY